MNQKQKPRELELIDLIYSGFNEAVLKKDDKYMWTFKRILYYEKCFNELVKLIMKKIMKKKNIDKEKK